MNATDAPFLVGNRVLVCNHYWAAWQYPGVVTEVIPPIGLFHHTRYRVAFDTLRYSPTVFSDKDLVHVEDVADENWMPDNETMKDEPLVRCADCHNVVREDSTKQCPTCQKHFCIACLVKGTDGIERCQDCDDWHDIAMEQQEVNGGQCQQ
jgi:hypothetical protein